MKGLFAMNWYCVRPRSSWMSSTKWLIPPRMSIAVFEEGNQGMFVSIPCTTASSGQKLKFKFTMTSLISEQTILHCTRSYKVLLSVAESIGNVRSHQTPDFKTRFRSQQSSCLCARCPSWKMNLSCWPCNLLLWIEEWYPKYVLQLFMKLSLLTSCQWRFC